MSKLSSLLLLINSLDKSEQKKISSTFNPNNKDADYTFLYKLIVKNLNCDQEEIKKAFSKGRPNATFNTAVNYLFDNLLSILGQLHTNKDSHFMLFNMLMNARILYEKSIYSECFQLLDKIQKKAIYNEKFMILLIAQKMELDYLLTLDFPNITEQELLNKQLKINDTLKKIRKINEHASLYELLRYRILYKGPARNNKQKQEFNDLVVSEISIVSSSRFENFEIQKTHKLFQSNYLISVGDYKSALFSFFELNNIFEVNKHLLSTPPIYYLSTIEGVLESLRAIKNYDGMSYFTRQLNNLETASTHFRIQIHCVVFLYNLFPLIDIGDFEKAKHLINEYKEIIYDKIHLLIPARQIQLLLYTAITYLGATEYKKARKTIIRIIATEKNLFSLPLLTAARLINLIILYELREYDYIESEIRSMKREIQNKGKAYQIELLILRIINKPIKTLQNKEKILLWNKYEALLKDIQNSKSELQLLHIFDFTAWIESKIKGTPLSIILKRSGANVFDENSDSSLR